LKHSTVNIGSYLYVERPCPAPKGLKPVYFFI